jgi:hypothetical protein
MLWFSEEPRQIKPHRRFTSSSAVSFRTSALIALPASNFTIARAGDSHGARLPKLDVR